ncbi:MAG: tRNA (N6-isopentenyl adenosine(37)-C2)-methylthiotransferase MiaB, partial [Candidatus Omnitrophica bacterium]|nr:tRNA (N6-isopentenyl adenosine(37)-C2)-methylthiotransferase MiaB [Candidatus Omnitrophota bacterium]
ALQKPIQRSAAKMGSAGKSDTYDGKGKRLYIVTYGCQMNDRDSEALAGLFLDRGYEMTEIVESADVILINTCSVRDHAENRAISFAGSLKEIARHKDTRHTSHEERTTPIKPIIGLIGCMARNRGEDIFQKMPHIDLIVGPAHLDKIPDFVDEIRNPKHEIRKRIIQIEDEERSEALYHPLFRVEPGHAQIVISTGCSNWCSYCVVPHVRGPLRLRTPQDIIEEVKRNVDAGIKKVTLLGQNVNDYEYTSHVTGHTTHVVNFVDLLKEIDKIDGVEELSFITNNPKNTSKELFEVMAHSPKIVKHLHMPFQSGSNRILELMNRGYTREKYLQLAEEYKKITGGTLGTDVIVGFPNEAEKDFLQTEDLMRRVRFKCAFIFKYSPRPGTKAAGMPDDVTEVEKKRRHAVLLEMQKKISKENYTG